MTDKIHSLAMLKMEKNFVAHIEKKYPRRPYSKQCLEFLAKRLAEEGLELVRAINCRNTEAAKLECADVSNIVDYIFEGLCRVENGENIT